jgi:hypothetical protein
MFGDINLVLANIKPDDIVLDVGGWACPFNRANWVLDAEPYETRGFYGQIGLPSSQGGDKEFFSQETWVQRDMFTMKYHTIHSNFQLSFPPSYVKKLSTDESIDYIFWNNDFSFAETQIHGVDNISEELRNFVASRYKYPQYMLSAQKIGDTARRLLNGIKRRIIALST